MASEMNVIKATECVDLNLITSQLKNDDEECWVHFFCIHRASCSNLRRDKLLQNPGLN